MIQNMNLQDSDICEKHGERIMYIDKEQSDAAKRSLCIKCVVEKNSNLKMIDNLRSQLEYSKEQLIQNRKSRTQQNIDILKDLNNFLHQQKGKFIVQIEKCQQNIHNQISLLEKANLSYMKKIEQITISDLNNPDKLKSQLKLQNIDCKGVKDNLTKQMNSLEVFLMKSSYEERIQQIDFGDQNLELEQLCDQGYSNNNHEQKQPVIWRCDEHQENIMFIDLGQEQTIPNRLACIKCVPKYKIQFTEIDYLKQQWEQNRKNTKNQAQIYIDFQQKSNNQIIKIIKEFKFEINQEIDKLNQLIEESIQFNFHTYLEKDWQQITKEEIIMFINSLVYRNFELSIKSIKKEIKYQFKLNEELLKNTIISNLYKIYNKIDGLVSEIKQDTLPKENTNEQNKKHFQIRRFNNYSILGPISSRNEKLHIENSPQSFREINIDSKRDSFEIGSSDCNSPLQHRRQKNQLSNKSQFFKKQYFPLQYEVAKESDENSEVLAITINQEQSILVLGCYMGIIKVFSFNNGEIKLIDMLKEHTLNVRCLYFMKKSQSFLSGSNDRSIIIWKQDFENKWYNSQRLLGHQDQVLCLLMNSKENLIISGSRDQTIRFWIKEYDWICHQILTAHQNSVRSLSLNCFEDQLISCAEEELKIVVTQFQQDFKTWVVVNEIKVNKSGSSLLFISENMFAFQPTEIDQLYLFKQKGLQYHQYTYNQSIKIKTEEVCTALFPIMFIQSKSILITKNGSFINVIQKDMNNQYVTEQSFENPSNCCAIRGTLTSNGEFLIIWNGNVKKIIVNRLKNY